MYPHRTSLVWRISGPPSRIIVNLGIKTWIFYEHHIWTAHLSKGEGHFILCANSKWQSNWLTFLNGSLWSVPSSNSSFWRCRRQYLAAIAIVWWSSFFYFFSLLYFHYGLKRTCLKSKWGAGLWVLRGLAVLRLWRGSQVKRPCGSTHLTILNRHQCFQSASWSVSPICKDFVLQD